MPSLLKITTWPLSVTSPADTNALCTPATRVFMFMFTGVPISVTASNFLKPWSCTHARPSVVTNLNQVDGAAKLKTSPTFSGTTRVQGHLNLLKLLLWVPARVIVTASENADSQGSCCYCLWCWRLQTMLLRLIPVFS